MICEYFRYGGWAFLSIVVVLVFEPGLEASEPKITQFREMFGEVDTRPALVSKNFTIPQYIIQKRWERHLSRIKNSTDLDNSQTNLKDWILQQLEYADLLDLAYQRGYQNDPRVTEAVSQMQQALIAQKNKGYLKIVGSPFIPDEDRIREIYDTPAFYLLCDVYSTRTPLDPEITPTSKSELDELVAKGVLEQKRETIYSSSPNQHKTRFDLIYHLKENDIAGPIRENNYTYYFYGLKRTKVEKPPFVRFRESYHNRLTREHRNREIARFDKIALAETHFWSAEMSSTMLDIIIRNPWPIPEIRLNWLGEHRDLVLATYQLDGETHEISAETFSRHFNSMTVRKTIASTIQIENLVQSLAINDWLNKKANEKVTTQVQ